MTGKNMADFPKTRQIVPVMYFPVADLSSFFSEVNKFSTEISVFDFCYLLKKLFQFTVFDITQK